MTSAARSNGQAISPPTTWGPTGCSRKLNRVTTPTLPPPPRSAQNRSGGGSRLAGRAPPRAARAAGAGGGGGGGGGAPPSGPDDPGLDEFAAGPAEPAGQVAEAA